MKLGQSKNCNVNYLAKVVSVDGFTAHTNPEVERLKVAHVDGYSILVGINESEGKFVYFPTSCCINPQLLSYANLYRHTEKNANPEEKPGMFEDNGRVKAIRLKGQVSEGFLLPLQVLLNFIVSSTNVNIEESDCPVGTEFDEVQHNGKSFWINRKFIVEAQTSNNSQKHYSHRQKGLKKFSRLVEEQFHFHYDTVLLRKSPEVIQPGDLIHLSHKWHGTSAIFANVLCRHPLTWKEKIARWFTKDEFLKYENLYSSRSVIKNADIVLGKASVGSGFYGDGGDVWKYANEVIKPYLIKGMTIYAEICGFLPSGSYVQKNYDYGCICPKPGEEYTYGKHYKIMIYRITLTNQDGIVHEFSAREVQIWCKNNGLTPVIECYYGYAKDLYPDIPISDSWSEEFMNRLADDERFYMEKSSPDCNNKVPHEGLVIKREDMISHAWKLKCFAFLDKEQRDLDKGETNIEDLA